LQIRRELEAQEIFLGEKVVGVTDSHKAILIPRDGDRIVTELKGVAPGDEFQKIG
jgi:hypothetical protein